MEKQNFWNVAAKYGAILGALLALSGIAETAMILSGNVGLYLLLILEWFGVAVLHYYLLHRFSRNRSQLYSQEEGFTFGQCYGFLTLVSAFAGIWAGIVQYLQLHVVIGYSNYVDRLAAVVSDMISRSGGIPASVQTLYTQGLTQMQNAPEPSLLATVWAGLFSSLLFGAVFGLIIAGMLSRAPKPFGSEDNQMQ